MHALRTRPLIGKYSYCYMVKKGQRNAHKPPSPGESADCSLQNFAREHGPSCTSSSFPWLREITVRNFTKIKTDTVHLPKAFHSIRIINGCGFWFWFCFLNKKSEVCSSEIAIWERINLGCWDGSVGMDACYQAWQTEFDPQDPCGRRKNCLLKVCFWTPHTKPRVHQSSHAMVQSSGPEEEPVEGVPTFHPSMGSRIQLRQAGLSSKHSVISPSPQVGAS